MEISSKPHRGGPVLATLRHRWPEYLIEVFVIVFSTSISFGLDQWKDARHEDEVEQLYPKTLSDNLAGSLRPLGCTLYLRTENDRLRVLHPAINFFA